MSRLLARFATLKTVTLQPYTGFDGQGLPAYGSAVTFTARVRESGDFVNLLDGSQVRITLELWLPSATVNVPNEKDRVVYGGSNYIVEMVDDVRDFKDERSHLRVRCRDE
jgi:hypothetical protein